MVFDTTADNTGHLTAACIKIQEKLNRPLLWSGCCHHIGELVIHHVFTDLKIEASKSPDISLFTRLRDNWELIPRKCPPNHLSMEGLTEEAQALVTRLKTELLSLQAVKKDFVRDDYDELLSLSVAFVSEEVTEVSFRSPGALHKARWMSKIIYALKIVLLEPEIADLPKGTITSNTQVPKLRYEQFFFSKLKQKANL